MFFTFPKAPGKQSTDSTEGRAAPAPRTGPEHDRDQRGPTQQPAMQRVDNGMLAENDSKCTHLIQRAGALLSPRRRFPGGCCAAALRRGLSPGAHPQRRGRCRQGAAGCEPWGRAVPKGTVCHTHLREDEWHLVGKVLGSRTTAPVLWPRPLL